MRRRILYLVFLGLLMSPVAARTEGAEIDPNGQPATAQGAIPLGRTGPETVSESYAASTPSLWKVLLDWLERLDLRL